MGVPRDPRVTARNLQDGATNFACNIKWPHTVDLAVAALEKRTGRLAGLHSYSGLPNELSFGTG